MEKFKVGDKVVMNENANDYYSITREGSWGYITKVYSHAIEIKFMEFKGTYEDWAPNTYTVDMSCVNLMEKYDPTKAILNKINNMYTRQPYYAKQKAMV